MVSARLSATVILTREGPAGLEVYLVLRSRELSFFGGSWAFPGGTLDGEDRRPDEEGEERALRRCALRELFEETGVLLAPIGATGAEREGWRATLLEEAGVPEGFAAYLDGSAAERLHHVGTVETPPFAPLRYRTAFFHLVMPADEEPLVLPGELDEGRFFPLEELFHAWRGGELHLVPPVVYLLERLRGLELAEGLVHVAEECRAVAAGRFPATFAVPGVFVAPLRTPTLPPATTTNCYVVGHEQAYVVDPATYEESERERLYAALDRRVRDGVRLAGVLLTHHHEDHVGSALAVARRHGLPLLAHPLTHERVPGDFPGRRSVLDGERLPLGTAPDGTPGWTLEALHTPGHAPGHLVFVESRYGAALVGDLMSTASTIVIDPADGHLATYLASLRRLAERPFGFALPAHGGMYRDGPGLVRRYLAHRAEREELLVRALESGPATPDELLPVVYADTPPSAHPLARLSLLSGLEKLAEEGRARCIEDRWGARSA